jgi:hypothetical protein
MRKQIDQPVGDVAGDVAAAMTGIGILVMVLFPFAIPALLLTAALAAPLVLPVAALAVGVALVVRPVSRDPADCASRRQAFRPSVGHVRASLRVPTSETRQSGCGDRKEYTMRVSRPS